MITCVRCNKPMPEECQSVKWSNPHHSHCWTVVMREHWLAAGPEGRKRIESLITKEQELNQ